MSAIAAEKMEMEMRRVVVVYRLHTTFQACCYMHWLKYSLEGLTHTTCLTLTIGGGPFDETYTFVQFYAPWCSHCASFAPTYDALSHAFKGQESPKVVIARMDITKEKTFSRRYEVTSLPMLRLFKGADPIDTLPYLGRRTLDDMIDYLNQKTGSDRRKDGSVGINGNTCSSE